MRGSLPPFLLLTFSKGRAFATNPFSRAVIAAAKILLLFFPSHSK